MLISTLATFSVDQRLFRKNLSRGGFILTSSLEKAVPHRWEGMAVGLNSWRWLIEYHGDSQKAQPRRGLGYIPQRFTSSHPPPPPTLLKVSTPSQNSVSSWGSGVHIQPCGAYVTFEGQPFIIYLRVWYHSLAMSQKSQS